MELMGLNLYAFMWLRILDAALAELGEGNGDKSYLDGLVKTGEFFFARLLPHTVSRLEEIKAGASTLMAMTAEQF